MTNGWHTVPFGEFLTERKEFFTIDDFSKYKRARVQSHGKGIILRDEIDGVEIKTKRQQAARAGEFLVAEIDAKVGGFGIVPSELDSAVVSSHYFLFQINEKKCLKDWLNWFVRYNSLEDQVKAQGSTNYAAIRPSHVLDLKIPLPPIHEQERIVSRLKEVNKRIDDVIVKKNDINKEQNHLLLSAFYRIIENVDYREMENVAPLVRRPVEVKPEENYLELGVRSFGKGTFHKTEIDGFSLGSKRVFYIESGDLIFSNVFAWEGAIAVARITDEGRIGSHRFITCVAKENLATPEFLCFYFLTPEGLDKIGKASPGGAGRNRTLGIEKLMKVSVPLPKYEEQLWFTQLLAKVDELRRLQSESERELSALMPSILDKAFKGEL